MEHAAIASNTLTLHSSTVLEFTGTSYNQHCIAWDSTYGILGMERLQSKLESGGAVHCDINDRWSLVALLLRLDTNRVLMAAVEIE